MKEQEVSRSSHPERRKNFFRERAIQNGVRPPTYDFLVAAIKNGAHHELDVRRRNLIGAYFMADVSLKDLVPMAQITSRQEVAFLLKSGLKMLWEHLPAKLQEKYSPEEVVQLKDKGVFSPSRRAKVSETQTGKKHSPAVKEKIGTARTRRNLSPGAIERQREAARRRWQDPEYRARVSAGHAKRNSLSQEARSRRSVAAKKSWKNPEIRAKRIKNIRKRLADPEVKARMKKRKTKKRK